MSTVINRARDALVVALIIAAVAGSIYTGLATSNYYQFYPALTKLQLNLANLQWKSVNSTGSYSLNGTAVFKLENPTSYNGLLLHVFQPSLDVQLNSSNTTPQGLLQSAKEGSLSPQNVLTINTPFQGSLDTPQQVAETVKRGGTVLFIFSINVYLNTFLDSAASVSVYYKCTSSMGSGTCEQTGILIVPGRSFGSQVVGGI